MPGPDRASSRGKNGPNCPWVAEKDLIAGQKRPELPLEDE